MMNDKELKNVLEETIQDAQENTVSEEVGEAEAQSVDNGEMAVPDPLQNQKEETGQAKNFKALKAKLEAAERERDEAMRLAYQYDQYYKSQQQPQQKYEEPEKDISDDELIEGKYLKKYKRDTEEKIRQLEEKMQYQTTEARLKAKYNDFDSLVTPANLKRLAAEHPDIAKTLDSSNDLYSKAVTAYTLIKKLGIADEEIEYGVSKAVVESNAKKPKTATSIAPSQNVTPLSRANAFNGPMTEALRDKLIAEMEEAIRNKGH